MDRRDRAAIEFDRDVNTRELITKEMNGLAVGRSSILLTFWLDSDRACIEVSP